MRGRCGTRRVFTRLAQRIRGSLRWGCLASHGAITRSITYQYARCAIWSSFHRSTRSARSGTNQPNENDMKSFHPLKPSGENCPCTLARYFHQSCGVYGPVGNFSVCTSCTEKLPAAFAAARFMQSAPGKPVCSNDVSYKDRVS